jgi:hypothetical protein
MRVRCALGLLVALLLAGCGEDEPRDRAAARTKATPTASPTPSPTPDSGRLTDAQVAVLDRADKRVRRTGRAYLRAMNRCSRDPLTVRECVAGEYRPHSRAMKATIAALGNAREAADKHCRAQVEDTVDAARAMMRANDAIQRALAERRYDDAVAGADDKVDAELAYEGAFDQIVTVCEDI